MDVMGTGWMPDPDGFCKEIGRINGCRGGHQQSLPQSEFGTRLYQNGDMAIGKPSDLTVRRSMVTLENSIMLEVETTIRLENIFKCANGEKVSIDYDFKNLGGKVRDSD